jgi:hypothetical protein
MKVLAAAALIDSLIADVRLRVPPAAWAEVRNRHTIEHTVTAWLQALDQADRRHVEDPPPTPTIARRLRDALGGVMEGPLPRLRRFNREPLARRRPGQR